MFKKLSINAFLVLILSMSFNLMADLILSEGGATGTYFNAARSGEGFYVEIIEFPDGSRGISVAMYSFDENGEQLWLVGTSGVGAADRSANITLFRYDGPVWGPNYDPKDLNETAFGTMFAKFPNCDTALFSIQSDGALQSGDYSLVRLTEVVGVECKEPVDPPSGITTGTWSGFGVCFHVSADGNSLVGGESSGCSAQSAFDSNLDGITNEFKDCKVTAKCEAKWPIRDGKFYCVNEVGEMAIGTFDSDNSASGWGFEGEGGVGEFCSAPWTATPGRPD